MSQIKLISLDLDGTLLDSNREIPTDNVKALNKARNEGVTIIISTGSPFELIPFNLLEKLDIDFAITANGSAIYNYKTAQCMYEDTIEAEEQKLLLDFLVSKDIHMDIFIDGKGYTPLKCKTVIEKLSVPASRKEYLRNNRTWLDNPIEYIEHNKLHIQKITINFYPDSKGTLVDYEEVKSYVKNREKLNLTTGVKCNLEITKAGVDKGVAIEKLSEIVAISLKDMMAFGDSLNDLPLLKKVGLGIAMENAMDEVLDELDLVTETNNECGVAKGIRRWMY